MGPGTNVTATAINPFNRLPPWAEDTVTVLVFLTGTVLAMFFAGRLVRGAFRKRGEDDQITINVSIRLVQAIVALVGIELTLHHFEINLSTLFAASGLVAVGLGFGAKTLIENTIAGIMLRLERTIRKGDIIDLDGRWLRILHIGFRATSTVTYEDEEVLIPNSTLAESTVSNLTRRGAQYRIRADVGVAYESDLKLVRKTLEDCVKNLRFRSKQRDSLVILDEFADSSVNYSARVWIDNADDSLTHRSELREAIWWALQEAGITLAFPQLDVHVDRVEPDSA